MSERNRNKLISGGQPRKDCSHIVAIWNSISSDNTTKMHQYRLHAIIALVGLGSMIEAIFMDDNNMLGNILIFSLTILMMITNHHYRRKETAWSLTSRDVQTESHRAYIESDDGYQYVYNLEKIPDILFEYHYSSNPRLFRFDFLTTFALVLFLGINISLGLKLASGTYSLKIEKLGQTSAETSTPIPKKRPLAKMMLE